MAARKDGAYLLAGNLDGKIKLYDLSIGQSESPATADPVTAFTKNGEV